MIPYFKLAGLWIVKVGSGNRQLWQLYGTFWPGTESSRADLKAGAELEQRKLTWQLENRNSLASHVLRAFLSPLLKESLVFPKCFGDKTFVSGSCLRRRLSSALCSPISLRLVLPVPFVSVGLATAQDLAKWFWQSCQMVSCSASLKYSSCAAFQCELALFQKSASLVFQLLQTRKQNGGNTNLMTWYMRKESHSSRSRNLFSSGLARSVLSHPFLSTPGHSGSRKEWEKRFTNTYLVSKVTSSARSRQNTELNVCNSLIRCGKCLGRRWKETSAEFGPDGQKSNWILSPCAQWRGWRTGKMPSTARKQRGTSPVWTGLRNCATMLLGRGKAAMRRVPGELGSVPAGDPSTQLKCSLFLLICCLLG